MTRPLPALVIALAVLVSAFVPAAPARAQVLLRWEWREGQRFTYTLTETMEQKIDAAGLAGGQVTERRHERVMTIEDEVLRADEGRYTVRRTFARVRMTLEEEGERVEFDSDRDQAASDSRIAPFAQLAGASIEFDTDREGRVSEVRGAAEALQRVYAALSGNPLAAAMGGVDREALRRQIEQGLRIMPNRTVEPGQTWSNQVEQQMPLIGGVRTNTTYRYVGGASAQGRECARIESHTELSLVSASGQSPLGLTITLERGSGEGRILIDPDRGAIVRWEQSLESAWSGKGQLAPDQPTGFRQHLKQSAVMELVSGG